MSKPKKLSLEDVVKNIELLSKAQPNKNGMLKMKDDRLINKYELLEKNILYLTTRLDRTDINGPEITSSKVTEMAEMRKRVTTAIQPLTKQDTIHDLTLERLNKIIALNQQYLDGYQKKLQSLEQEDQELKALSKEPSVPEIPQNRQPNLTDAHALPPGPVTINQVLENIERLSGLQPDVAGVVVIDGKPFNRNETLENNLVLCERLLIEVKDDKSGPEIQNIIAQRQRFERALQNLPPIKMLSSPTFREDLIEDNKAIIGNYQETLDALEAEKPKLVEVKKEVKKEIKKAPETKQKSNANLKESKKPEPKPRFSILDSVKSLFSGKEKKADKPATPKSADTKNPEEKKKPQPPTLPRGVKPNQPSTPRAKADDVTKSDKPEIVETKAFEAPTISKAPDKENYKIPEELRTAPLKQTEVVKTTETKRTDNLNPEPASAEFSSKGTIEDIEMLSKLKPDAKGMVRVAGRSFNRDEELKEGIKSFNDILDQASTTKFGMTMRGTYNRIDARERLEKALKDLSFVGRDEIIKDNQSQLHQENEKLNNKMSSWWNKEPSTPIEQKEAEPDPFLTFGKPEVAGPELSTSSSGKVKPSPPSTPRPQNNNQTAELSNSKKPSPDMHVTNKEDILSQAASRNNTGQAR
jgi:hypothetical protein